MRADTIRPYEGDEESEKSPTVAVGDFSLVIC